MTYAFGPGPITRAVRAIIVANVAVFFLTLVAPAFVITLFGLTPEAVIEQGRVWQLGTYLFVHSPQVFTHILFNMLTVWMFGVELERRWGTRAFTVYYFVTGVGAAICVVLVSLIPAAWAASSYVVPTIGASGAVYGLLLAWAMLYPDRQILFMFIFPVSARVFVLIIGAIAFFSAVGTGGGPVSHFAHLGGLAVGWFYLRGPKNLQLTLRYYVTRWRMERMRRRYNVHKGGRDDWRNRIH
jgi:membrane associated rhomboid family serine protease